MRRKNHTGMLGTQAASAVRCAKDGYYTLLQKRLQQMQLSTCITCISHMMDRLRYHQPLQQKNFLIEAPSERPDAHSKGSSEFSLQMSGSARMRPFLLI